MNHSTPIQAFLHWENNTPGNLFLRQPVDGEWREFNYKEAAKEVRAIAAALKKQFPQRTNIAILSKNCAHWILCDLAIMLSGNISVPIYPTLSAEGIRQILEHSEAKAVFIGKLDNFKEQRHAIAPELVKISFPWYGINEGTLWSDLIKENNGDNLQDTPEHHEIASIMYSSGTTGTAKGVMLSHGAFGFVGKSVTTHFNIVSPEQFFSYLPLSHIAERALMEMVALASGSKISFSESLDKFQENLVDESPTLFGGVPRIYSKFQEGVLKKFSPSTLNTLLAIPGIKQVLGNAIRKKLGFSKARIIVSGAAPIPIVLLHWFKKLGVNIMEVYGMTENTAYSHANFRRIKIGSVGEPWPECEAKLSEEGEILVRHPALMKGYYKDDETTASVFTDDHFLRTGDKGYIDKDGFWFITGRIKDQFKTDKGKFIAPAPIELRLLGNLNIDQASVVGMGLPQPIGLIVLNSTGNQKSREEIANDLESLLGKVNAPLENYERLEKLVIMNEPWTIENGLLTPSLKIKRTELEKRFLSLYQHWYKHKEKIIWQ